MLRAKRLQHKTWQDSWAVIPCYHVQTTSARKAKACLIHISVRLVTYDALRSRGDFVFENSGLSSAFAVLYGGRCEVFRYLVKATEEMKIDMRDFVSGRTQKQKCITFKIYKRSLLFFRLSSVTQNSLYPSIMRNLKMPKKHPTVYSCNFPPLDEWVNKIGLAYVRVRPPADLLIPILKSHLKVGQYKKLMAVLCTECALAQTEPPCSHNDDQRFVEGTYTTPLLKLALEEGYAVSAIYGLWIYEKSTTKLFKAYIDTFFKAKLAASGFPGDVNSEEQKQSYVNELNVGENMNLKVEDIEHNEALRSLVKLFLNNLWYVTLCCSTGANTTSFLKTKNKLPVFATGAKLVKPSTPQKRVLSAQKLNL